MKVYANKDNLMAYFYNSLMSAEGKIKKFEPRFNFYFSAVFLLLPIFSSVAKADNVIQVPMDLATWNYKEQHLECTLIHNEESVGSIYFHAVTNRSTTLELKMKNKAVYGNNAELYRMAPPWMPAEKDFISDGYSEPRSNKIKFRQGVSELIQAVEQGSWINIQLSDDKSTPLADIRIPAIRFKPSFDQFTKCQSALPDITYAQARDTRLFFDVGQKELTGKQRQNLKALSSFIQADDTVTKVLVDGHTDNVGTNAANLNMSRIRAEAVEKMLNELGVPDQMIEVRAHGSRYPVASNSSAIGKAQNRRVSIRLVRNDESVVFEQSTQNNDAGKVQ